MAKNKNNTSNNTKNTSRNSTKNSSKNSVKDSHAQVPDPNTEGRSGPGGE